MSDFVIPGVFAALLWWLTTGILLYLDRLPRITFPMSLFAATLVVALALYGVHLTSDDTSVAGAYLAFVCSVLVWGWLEMSFLMGFITGPRKHACGSRCSGWRHLGHAIQAIIYHELAILLGAVVMLALTSGQPNQFGLWTFTALWTLRLSAKLNLFFGVPNLGEQFLPEHLKYLCTYFKRRAMNFLFPISISGGTLACVLVIQQMLGASSDFETTGLALLGAMLVLGVLEHWFLVLPLPTETLWKWTLQTPRRELPPLTGIAAVGPLAGSENSHE